MEDNLDFIYNELNEMKAELFAYLNTSNPNPAILQYILAEIRDIDSALFKIEIGRYGKCDFSGRQLPEEILLSMPTAATMQDVSDLGKFCRKPLYC